jgi:iron complex transport system permease protein
MRDILQSVMDPTYKNTLQIELIITHIRLPRALLAAIIGSMLGISGAATQGLFRNPLADPSLIGVTAGASTGASVIIVLGSYSIAGIWGLSLISLGAFVGGILTVLLVYYLANGATTSTSANSIGNIANHTAGGISVTTMLLAGIGITALAGSITSLMELIADNDMLRRISLWRMGGLDGANYYQVTMVTIVGGVVLLLLPRYSNALNALLLGESEARHLGIDLKRVKYILILLVAAAVGTSVAMAGSIAFIGLVTPHIIRLLIGPNHHYLLPASALAGAVLLLLADTIARTIIAPVEMPTGIVTAIVGAPFFISLLRRYQYGFA